MRVTDRGLLKMGLQPIARPDAQLFILGSLPGDASLAAERYYAHPTNQFWRLVGHALDESLATLDYEARLYRLAERRVGLWDVIASARRPGSLDQAIRDAERNRVEQLVASFPRVRAIAFNGATAARHGAASLAGLASPPHILILPSSSAANTAPFEQKAQAWAALAQWAGAKSLRHA